MLISVLILAVDCFVMLSSRLGQSSFDAKFAFAAILQAFVYVVHAFIGIASRKN